MTTEQKVREILGKVITHYWVDEDNWYSCPKAPDGCSDESRGTECNCGRDRRLDEATAEITALFRSMPEEMSKALDE